LVLLLDSMQMGPALAVYRWGRREGRKREGAIRQSMNAFRTGFWDARTAAFLLSLRREGEKRRKKLAERAWEDRDGVSF